MGWIYYEDNLAIEPIQFDSLESCIEFCLNNGISYQISYPNKRYHVKKDYAENFK